MNQTGTGGLTVVQSECKTKFTYRVICILNKNRHSTHIISDLVTCRFTFGQFSNTVFTRARVVNKPT